MKNECKIPVKNQKRSNHSINKEYYHPLSSNLYRGGRISQFMYKYSKLARFHFDDCVINSDLIFTMS